MRKLLFIFLLFSLTIFVNTVFSSEQGSLMKAIETGNVNQVKSLIDSGQDVNMKNPPYDDTPLMAAAYKGLPMVKVLVEKGADLNTQDKYGATALMYAASEGALDVVKYLVTNGAKADIRDQQGETAADLAKGMDHNDVASYLSSVKN